MTRGIFLALTLMLSSARLIWGAEATAEVVVLPRFVVEADRLVFSMSWRCKWPTQK